MINFESKWVIRWMRATRRRVQRQTDTGSQASTDPFETSLQAGDQARDAGDTKVAIGHYTAALEHAPSHAAIRVQLGNMLKDDGQLDQAVSNYLVAIQDDPDVADTHLQLGHARKLQGQRSAALECYRRAVALDPHCEQALVELARAGQETAQVSLLNGQIRSGSLQQLLELTGQVADTVDWLERVVEVLPDIRTWTAFPVSQWHRYRRWFDVPAPPAPPPDCSIAVLLQADAEAHAALHAILAALTLQDFTRWRLIAIGSDPARRLVVERAAAIDSRVQWQILLPGEDMQVAERRLAVAAGSSWCLLLAQGAVLHRHALGWIAAAGQIGPAAAFVCDEEGRRSGPTGPQACDPLLRQIVDFDTLLETNPFGETVAVRREVLADPLSETAPTSRTYARSRLLLQLAKSSRVGHLPFPLVCRHEAPVIDRDEHAAAVAAQLADLPHSPWLADACVTVIVPTRNNATDLACLAASLRARAERPDLFRLIIVDNGSEDRTDLSILERLAGQENVRLLRDPSPFNWSQLNNRAAALAGPGVLVFANDDMVMMSQGWDCVLRNLLARPGVGAVGAKLLYGATVQHAGILMGWGEAPTHHDGLHEVRDSPGPACRWQVTRAAAAVTGAFLAVRHTVLTDHDGFNEAFAVSYGDVDFCLRLRQSGLRLLWTPNILLLHHESKTRGMDTESDTALKRDGAEEMLMHRRWGSALRLDPSVNPTWHPATLPFRLVAAPTLDRATAHIRLCASANPWQVEREDD